MTPREAIERLQTLKEEVQRPEAFYRAKLPEWEALARNVAIGTLLALKPDRIQRETWKTQVANFAGRISSALILEEEVGARLFVSAGRMPRDDVKPYAVEVPFDVVQRWVEAGREGDPLGKRILETDEPLSSGQIAWRVFHAIRRQKSDALKRALEYFTADTGQGEMDEMGSNVMTAWVQVFEPRVAADWEQWVNGLVRAVG